MDTLAWENVLPLLEERSLLLKKSICLKGEMLFYFIRPFTEGIRFPRKQTGVRKVVPCTNREIKLRVYSLPGRSDMHKYNIRLLIDDFIVIIAMNGCRYYRLCQNIFF